MADEVKLGGAYIDIVAKNDKLIAGLNAAMNRTETATKKMEAANNRLAAAQNRLAGSTSNGMNSLTQFNRIVQDSPYGIIGITNNIQTFSESFGYLVKSTGSAKAAVGAMLSSLTGAGGIMFAITAVTTVLQLFSMANQKASSDMNDFTLETLLGANEARKFEKSMRGINKELLEMTDGELAKSMGDMAGELHKLGRELILAQSMMSMGQSGTLWNAIFGNDPKELVEQIAKITGAYDKAAKINAGNSSIVGKLNAQIQAQEDIINDIATTEKDLKKAVEEKYNLEQKRSRLTETEDARQKRLTGEAKEQARLAKERSEAEAQVRASQYRMRPFDVQMREIQMEKAEREKMYRELAEYNKTLITSGNLAGLNKAMQERGNSEAWNPLNSSALSSKAIQESWKEDNSFIVSTMQDSINIIQSQFSNLWQGIFGEANSVFEQIAQMIANRLIGTGISWLLDLILPGSGIAAGSITAAIDGRASGGPVSSNMPYIVGEQGPELMIPKSSGSIIPAGQTASILSGNNAKELNTLINSVQAMNVNLMSVVTRNNNNNIKVEGELNGNDIYLSNKRTSKVIKRNC